MTLRQKRVLFTKLIAELTLWIFEQGYEVAYDRDGLKHMVGSLHYQGLAHDLILYKDGTYLTFTEDYTFAGEKWKTMNPLCRWGGDFKKKDGNHFSVEYEGRS
jgi:hypothetical protein